jgi:hypothetical protein
VTARDYDEFAAIADDDALLDRLALGDASPGGGPAWIAVPAQAVDGERRADPLAQLLGSWRAELDAASTMPLPAVLPLAETSERTGRRRLHRHTAGIAAAVVLVVAGSTGVAAAASGGHGPLAGLYRALVGSPPAHARADAATLARVDAILDRVAAGIARAAAAGGATANQLSVLGDRLDARLAGLRADLAELDTLPTNPPTLDNGGQSARTGDSTGAGPDERHGAADGRDAEDRGGATTEGGEGTRHGDDGDDAGSSGSTGSSQSGDGSGGTSGSDGGSGSDDGSGSGAGDGSGSGSGDGSGTDGSGLSDGTGSGSHDGDTGSGG